MYLFSLKKKYKILKVIILMNRLCKIDFSGFGSLGFPKFNQTFTIYKKILSKDQIKY